MNKDKCLNAVNQLLENRRTNGKIEENRRREEVSLKIPGYADKERELAEHHSAFFRFIADGDDSEEKFLAFRDRSLALQEEIKDLLVKNGYPETYLDPVHTCPICADEGVVDGVLCACYKQALSEEYLKLSGMDTLFSQCSFAKFDLSLFSDEAEGQFPSPRATMQTLLDFSKKYVQNFKDGSPNLLFFGDPGCGKTFLSICIGCELIRNGKFVLYAPVQTLLSDFAAETFKEKTALHTIEDYLNADLLIIDDLGTEMYSSMTESHLYNVINTRLTRQKPTVISTNLSTDQRADTYAERLNSRLTYSYLPVSFPPANLREAKLRRQAARRKSGK